MTIQNVKVLKTFVFLFMFVVAVTLADRLFFDRKINNAGTDLIKRPASYLFAKLEDARFFLNRLKEIKNLAEINEELKKENFRILSRLAGYEDLEDENEFFRRALSISPRPEGNIVYASIFYFQLGLNGYDVVLTKGSKDGIKENNAVITEEGFIIGRINKVYENYSRVLVVSDPEFAITVKVLDSDTAGIAKGALNDGLYIDLIVQDDQIKEGDVIVSDGIDFFSPSLILGTVSYVDIDETSIFKTVRVTPSAKDGKIGRVLVIGN